MGKLNKNTKKFIHKGGLKQQISRRPIQKKQNEARANKLNKAREYDAKEKSQQEQEEQFKNNLEKLIEQKKRLPKEKESLSIQDFWNSLQSGGGSDDDDLSEDISDDDGGDLEFDDGGEELKGKKAKKGQAQVKEDEEDEEMEGEEGEEYEGSEDGMEEEIEDEEGVFDEDAEFGPDDEDEGEEGEDEEEGENDDGGDDDDEDDGKQRFSKRKKAQMAANLAKLTADDLDLEEEIVAHKKELQSLEETDPTFYEFLAKEGKDVLDFDKLSHEMKEKKQIASGGIITVTSSLLDTWIKRIIEEDSVDDVKKLLTAFQVAVMTEDEAVESQMPFRIAKESVFNELMAFCLEHMTDVFYDLLDEDGKAIKPAKPDDAPTEKQILVSSLPGFAKIKKLVFIYANVVLKLMSESSDVQMLSIIIKNLVQFIPFIASSSLHAKKFLQALLQIWASSAAEARLFAFICLKQLTLYRPFPFINIVLRGLYLVYMHNCKSMNNVESLSSIAFMRASVVEMYGIDFECSYQHMFSYMRQLAVTLQKGLVAPNPESVGQVYSWQYLNALHLWSDVLCKYPNQEQLKHLLFPLIQVIQGSITLDGQPKYYPYRIHLIRMLNSLATHNENTFINSAPYCLDILGGPLMQTPLTYGDKNTVVDFKVMRKVTDKVMRTKQFQDELINQVTDLLATNLATYSYSVSFPELSTFVSKLGGEFVERMANSAQVNHFAQLMTSIEQNAKHIRKLREKIDKAPKDVTNSLKTFYSPNLKNTDKAPVALFLAKYTKQMQKWENILNEKRIKLEKFDNFESDEEKDGNESEEESAPVQNGTSENGAHEEKKDKKKKKKEKKPKAPPKLAKLETYQEDVVGDLVVSDDEEQPKKKRVKTDKPKTTPKQNGTTAPKKPTKKPKA